jgi:hypothetical protein
MFPEFGTARRIPQPFQRDTLHFFIYLLIYFFLGGGGQNIAVKKRVDPNLLP